MRLIDADALLKKHCTERAKGNCKRCDWYGDSHCSTEIFGTQIDFAPTIEAEPVMHGRWVERKEIFSEKEGEVDAIGCSECGKSQRKYRRTNYCHNCGAKMDLEGKK